MRHIIYVDGSVGVGKSTFIDILHRTFASVLMVLDQNRSKSSHHFNVEVLPEPLHRDWTNRIVDNLGYENLLKFLLVRKIVAIETWSFGIASDGMQELENNVLIVERSLLGDRRVNKGCEELFSDMDVKYAGASVHYIFIKNLERENAIGAVEDEQERLNMLYNRMELELGVGNSTSSVHRIKRPRHISSYYSEAAAIVRKVLGL